MRDLEEKPRRNVNFVQGISWQKHQNNEEESLPFLSHTGDVTEEAASTRRIYNSSGKPYSSPVLPITHKKPTFDANPGYLLQS